MLLSYGPHWEKLAWTRNGEPYKPDDRAHLCVFSPTDGVLAPGQSMTIGFEHEGTFPPGISKRTASAPEFILPAAVVLTGFRPSVVPVLGFADSVGIDDENRQDSKEYPDDFFEGQTDSILGARTPFSTRIAITGPAGFTLNSVGTMIEDRVEGGRRTTVWESEHPVSFFNVIAGRWAVERGEGTAVFYHPGHPYNIAEMRGARRGSPLLFRVVLPLSLARAETERVPQPRDLRTGVPDQHHLLRGRRLPHEEHARDPRSLRDHRA